MQKIISRALLFVLIISMVALTPTISMAKTKKYSFSKTFKDNGEIYHKVVLKRDVLQSKSKANKKINAYLKSVQNKRYKKSLSYAKKNIIGNSYGFYSSLYDKITLTYNKKGVYSFQENRDYIKSLASGGNIRFYGYTFSKKTGKILSTSQIIKKAGFSKKALKKAMLEKVKAYINKNNYAEKKAIINRVKKISFSKTGLYIKDNKLNVCIPPYTIGSSGQIVKIKMK